MTSTTEVGDQGCCVGSGAMRDLVRAEAARIRAECAHSPGAIVDEMWGYRADVGVSIPSRQAAVEPSFAQMIEERGSKMAWQDGFFSGGSVSPTSRRHSRRLRICPTKASRRCSPLTTNHVHDGRPVSSPTGRGTVVDGGYRF